MAAENNEKPEVNVRRSANPASADTELITLRGKRIKVTDEQFADMLEKAGGFKSRLAKQLGISISAVCHRIKRSKYLTEQCKTIEETVLDLAEAGLIKAAQNGEPWAITFILKCKGRKRGWIERQDLAFGASEELPPPIILPINDMAFVAAEAEKQKQAYAEAIDVAADEFGVTNATQNDVEVVEKAEIAPEATVSLPEVPEANMTIEAMKPTEKPVEAHVDEPKDEPKRQLKPSEVAALRRAKEAEAKKGNLKSKSAMPVGFQVYKNR